MQYSWLPLKTMYMKIIFKYLRILAFILLLLIAMAGIGIPIPMYHEDKFEEKKELVVKNKKG